MKTWKTALCALLIGFSLLQTAPVSVAAADIQNPPAVKAPPAQKEHPSLGAKALRSGRAGFRSPRMGYTGGTRARNPVTNTPVTRTPRVTTGRTGGFFGGLFGGFLAGSLLGSLFHPFGYGAGGGVSLLGILFWVVIIYFAYRLLRRAFDKGR
ncbi:hypothetical protein [Cohnella candidum]|uniref:Import inner membrane translocase subunit Tim44 n=1 Tax=Cohnella candidum TaxID=2674991 RepID=A0A3G3JVL2_9BACL|nr:hypothetical protein [Cohnella candidum]AYQ72272.1 hypothetical protein EAV92_06635 [Cohnella candidum]